MITYEKVTKCNHFQANVKLSGKLVGEIRAVDGGFQYWPQGKKPLGGDVLPNVFEVKAQIEEGQTEKT